MICRRLAALLAARRTALAAEGGFTMVLALTVLTVVSLMIAAGFVAAKGDINSQQHALEAKRAFYSARAGLNAFLYKLNRNTELWQTCPSQTATTVPGSTGQQYSYTSMPANGASACNASDPVDTMIDFGTGSFRMKFTGTSGTPAVTRTIVASFRRDTPLDYLWYSIYETLDPNTYADPANYQDCAEFLRDGRPSKCLNINWVTGDVVNGPMYTQDQYRICGAPVFGRAGSQDTVETAAPTNGLYAPSGCSNNAQLNGSLIENAPYITPPPDNTNLLTHAQTDGKVYNGTTTIVLNGNTASVTNGGSTTTVNLTTFPIIYVTNTSCSATYSPYSVTYPTTGGCGNVYVKGTYSTPLTIAAANDIIINGDISTNLSGGAVLGMVANNFIRIMHGMNNRTSASYGNCGSATNNPSQTMQNVRIDAAILALNHSFIVDNYDCGAKLGEIEVHGAIAQLFRGTVGTSGGGGGTGYLKDYNYDDRLAVQEPPYLFDLASSSWNVVRETACTQGGTGTNAC